MATRSSSKIIEGFYRQKKSTASTKKTSKRKSPKYVASLDSDVTPPAALISHDSFDLKDDYSKNEEALREFDMNMSYGPCLGITRLSRWERATRLGLNPPKEIEGLLKAGAVQGECLWHDRV